MMTIERDPRDRFTDRVENYVRFRPSYPPSVLSPLKPLLNKKGNVAVADLGSGTGVFSKLLLDAGFHTYAVEPNPAMRRAAEVQLNGHSGFHSVEGEGEATTLETASVDAITVAQAFHWFAITKAVSEFARILKPDGLVLLIWNDRRVDCDGFHRGYEDLLLQYGTDYSRINHRNITGGRIRELFNGWLCEEEKIHHFQKFDVDGLRGRLESSSYCPPEGHPDYFPLIRGLEDLFKREARDGFVRMEYDCTVYKIIKPINE